MTEMKKKIIALIFFVEIFFLFGCTETPTYTYTCRNGSIVSNSLECPEAEETLPEQEQIQKEPELIQEQIPLTETVQELTVEESIELIANSEQTISCGLNKRCFPNTQCNKMSGRFIQNKVFEEQQWAIDKAVSGNECQFFVKAITENKLVTGTCRIPLEEQKFFLVNCAGDYFDELNLTELKTVYEKEPFLDIGYIPSIICTPSGKKINASLKEGIAEITLEYATLLFLKKIEFSGDFAGKEFSEIEGQESDSFTFQIFGLTEFAQGGINITTTNKDNLTKIYTTYCTYK